MRYRTRESNEIEPLYCGTTYLDGKYPYGDGPWAYPTNYTYNPSIHLGKKRDREWCWDELHPGPPYRSGGPFTNWSVKTDWPSLGGVTSVIYWRYRYDGGFVIPANPLSYLTPASLIPTEEQSGFGDISNWGATGWNRFRPGRPRASLGQFLGEIRDVPRTLKTTAKGFHGLWKSMGGKRGSMANTPKAIGNHWLNTQFGWLPFLRDISDFINVAKNLESYLEQLRHENGRWVKRGGTLTSESDGEDLDLSLGAWPALSSYLCRPIAEGPYTTSTSTRTTTQRIWFEGRMRYYIPEFNGDSMASRAKMIAHLYGLTPGPSLVWELTPWSWMIDWVTNIGDVISNIDAIANQGAAAKYAFVMGTTEEKVEFTVTKFLRNGPVTISNYATATRKMRCKASPFGFGIEEIDLDPFQWSILGALGLSRLRFN